jgi:hypothetical protein
MATINSIGVATGAIGTVLKGQGVGVAPIFDTVAPSDAVTIARTQAAHGFVVGDLVYLVGTTYTKAIATSAATSEIVGMVSAVAGVNDFTLTTSGRVTGIPATVAGEVYFLSPTVAGTYTVTEPTTLGQVSKPIMVADTTSSGYLANFRGNVIGAVAVPTAAATQAEQEAATSITTYVSPGRQQFHPGHPKAWVSYTSITTTTIYASYNVTSLTDNGTGDTTINFITSFASINYAASAACSSDNTNLINAQISTSNVAGNPTIVTPTAAAFRVGTGANAIGFKDVTYNSISFFGDQ